MTVVKEMFETQLLDIIKAKKLNMFKKVNKIFWNEKLLLYPESKR